MVCTLGVLLPVAFVAGIVARKPVPVAAKVPHELIGGARELGKAVWTKTDIWPDRRIVTSLRRDAAGYVSVELMFRDLVKPDVLVYWAVGKETATNGLPEDAWLLGALSNQAPLPIPSGVRDKSGRFVLYSLADHEVVAVSQPFIIQND